MKTQYSAAIYIFFIAALLTACKGGFSGENKDSTMLDKHAMDSTARQNNKAGTLGGPQGDTSSKNDTTAGKKSAKP